jgi:DNA-binding MarR family transcriptional regulator
MSIGNKDIALQLLGLNRAMLKHGNEHRQDVLDLTMLQMQALTFIKGTGKATMSELAEELGITAASTTSLVDRLIKAEWVLRVSDPDDRRHVRLSLPPARQQKLSQIMERKMDRVSETLDHLSAEDLKELGRILNLLTSTIQSKDCI